MTLEELYANDPKLLKYYKKKLLQPGWAGELSPVEFAYVKTQLKKSPSLRRKLGFRPSARRLSEHRIRDVARHGISRTKRTVLASDGKK